LINNVHSLKNLAKNGMFVVKPRRSAIFYVTVNKFLIKMILAHP